MAIGVSRLRCWLFLGSLAIAGSASAQAPAFPGQAPPPPPPKPPVKLGPSNNTDLALLISSGNSRATSVGFRNKYAYVWPDAGLSWEAGWIRVASRDGDPYAVGTASSFEIVEPATTLDNERLYSKLHYQRQVSSRIDWFGDFDATRDDPANISRQLVIAGGLGTTWHKTDRLTFRTGYGISYTDEDLVVEGVSRFAGYRLLYNLDALVAPATTFESDLTLDGSFDVGDDIRTDWLNSVSVAMNSRVALKAGIRMLFRNVPALQVLALQSPSGVVIGTVDAPKDKLDTNIFSSLVITF